MPLAAAAMRRHGLGAAVIALSACASNPASPPTPAAAAAALSTSAPRPPPVADSPPEVDSSPPADELRRIVVAGTPALTACYASAVKENPALPGGIVAVKHSFPRPRR
jgi:hypothetical protein